MSLNQISSLTPPLSPIALPTLSSNGLVHEDSSVLELFIQAGFCDAQGILTFTPEMPPLEPDSEKIKAVKSKTLTIGNSTITIEKYIDRLLETIREKNPLPFKVYLRGSYASFILNPKQQLHELIGQFIKMHPEKRDVMKKAWKGINEYIAEPKEPSDVDWALQLDFPPDTILLNQFRSAIVSLHSELAGIRKKLARKKTFTNLLIPQVSEWNLSADPLVISSVSGDSVKLDVAIGFLNTTFMCTRDNHCLLMGAQPEATTLSEGKGFWQSIFDHVLSCYRLEERHAEDFSVSCKVIAALTQGKSINESHTTLKEIVRPFLKNGPYKIYKYLNKKLNHSSVNKTAFMINFLSLVDDGKLREEIWRLHRPKSRSFEEDAVQVIEQQKAFPSLYERMPLFQPSEHSPRVKPNIPFMKRRLFAESDPQKCSPDCFYAEWRSACESVKQKKPIPGSCIATLAEMFVLGQFTAEEEQIVDFSHLSQQSEFLKTYQTISVNFLSQLKNDDVMAKLKAIGARISETEQEWVVHLWIHFAKDQKIPLNELLKQIPEWLNAQNISPQKKETIALALLTSGLIIENDSLKMCMHNLSKDTFQSSLKLIPEELQTACILSYPEKIREDLEEDLSAKKLKELWYKTLNQTRSIFTLWKMERKRVPAPEKMAEEITQSFIVQSRLFGVEAEAELKEQIDCLQLQALQLLIPKLQPSLRIKAIEWLRTRVLSAILQGNLEVLEVFLKSKWLQEIVNITEEDMRRVCFKPEQLPQLLDLLKCHSKAHPFVVTLCQVYLEHDPRAHFNPDFCRLLFSLESVPHSLAQGIVNGVLEAPDFYLEELKASYIIPASMLYQLYPVYQKHNLKISPKMARSVLENIDQMETPSLVLQALLMKASQNELELDADLMQQLLRHYTAPLTLEELKAIESRSCQGTAQKELHDQLRAQIEAIVRNLHENDRLNEALPHFIWLEKKVRDPALRHSLLKARLHHYLVNGVGKSELLKDVDTPNEAFLAFHRLKMNISSIPNHNALKAFLLYCLENRIVDRDSAKTVLGLMHQHPQLLHSSATGELANYAVFCSEYEPLELDDRVSLLHLTFQHAEDDLAKKAFESLAIKAGETKAVSIHFSLLFIKTLCKNQYANLHSVNLNVSLEGLSPEERQKTLWLLESLMNLNRLLKDVLPYPGNCVDNAVQLLTFNANHHIPTYEEPYILLIVKTLLTLAPHVVKTLKADLVRPVLDLWQVTLDAEHASKAWITFMGMLIDRLEKEFFPHYLQILLQLTMQYYENRHKDLKRYTAEFSWLLNKSLSHPLYNVDNNYNQFILNGLSLMEDTRLMYFYCMFAPSNELSPFELKMRARMLEPDLEVIEKAQNLVMLRYDDSGVQWAKGISFQIVEAIRDEGKQLQLIRKLIIFLRQMGWTMERIQKEIRSVMKTKRYLQKFERVFKEKLTIPPKAEIPLTQKLFEEAVASLK